MECNKNQEPYKFKDLLEQWHTFVGMVLGYNMSSNMNLTPICYGDRLTIGNADRSSESDPIDRMLVLDCPSLMNYILGQIKVIENWKVMVYEQITEDMPIFRREDIDPSKIN